jgi:hypothetical protein
LLLLVGCGSVEPAQAETVIAAARPTCRALNRHILDRARHGSEITFLASPVTGGGFPLNRYEQLFLAAYEDGKRTPETMAGAAWSVLSPQGLIFTRDGKPLRTTEENVAELVGAARKFHEHLPRLQALGIAT